VAEFSDNGDETSGFIKCQKSEEAIGVNKEIKDS
jgi:hypothetical protein